jgi:hypothetical protein
LSSRARHKQPIRQNWLDHNWDPGLFYHPRRHASWAPRLHATNQNGPISSARAHSHGNAFLQPAGLQRATRRCVVPFTCCWSRIILHCRVAAIPVYCDASSARSALRRHRSRPRRSAVTARPSCSRSLERRVPRHQSASARERAFEESWGTAAAFQCVGFACDVVGDAASASVPFIQWREARRRPRKRGGRACQPGGVGGGAAAQ